MKKRDNRAGENVNIITGSYEAVKGIGKGIGSGITGIYNLKNKIYSLYRYY